MADRITFDVYQRIGTGTLGDLDASRLPADPDEVSRIITQHLQREGDLREDQVALVTSLKSR